jgi:predicted nuclease of predicted toxin-antitoxin system
MKILANENIPILSVWYLREMGYDVKAISEFDFGISDKEVMNIAIAENRLIITFDRDYGELIFKYNFKPQKGVIYLRLGVYEPDEPGHIVHQLIKNEEIIFENSLTVYDNFGIRQRKY